MKKLGLGFPLLSDPGLVSVRAYGIAMEGREIAVPATFVVLPDRRIAWRYVGETQADRPAHEAALDVVRRWKAKGP